MSAADEPRPAAPMVRSLGCLVVVLVWLLGLVLAPARPAVAQRRAAPSAEEQLQAARQAIRVRDHARGRDLLHSLLQRSELEPELATQARQELERLLALYTVHTSRIGLVAPLSGPYKKIGEALVRGAQLALALPGGPTVVSADSGGTPEGAAAAVERLVIEQGVVAVLGPIGDRECRFAALRAAELEVPIVVLGAAADLPGLSPWVHRHRITPTDQARAIASHALLDLGIRRFAILFPDDEYGREMMNALWDEVERGGGEIRAAESYPPQSRDADGAIRRLIGGYPAGPIRPDSFEIRAGEKKIAFQPLIDFEALFLPETPQRARQLLSQVSYYDVRLNTGDLRAGSRAAHSPVQVLGPGGWNGELIARGAEPVVQNAHFPGALVPQSPRPVVQQFLQRFQAAHRRAPTEIEAQAYDAAGWLFVAWQRGGSMGRPAVRTALGGLGGFMGVTGDVRILPDGGTRTELTILTVRGRDVIPLIYPWDRARAPASLTNPAPLPVIRMRD